MTIKFLRSGTPATQLTMPDTPALTLPAGDFALGVTVVMDGLMSGYGDAFQTIFRTGNSGDSSGLTCMWAPLDSGSNAGKFYFQIGGATTRCATIPVEAGKAYLLVLQRSSGAFTSKLCPILATNPTDTSAISNSLGYAHSIALDGAQGLIFGFSSLSNRRLDQSIGRFFRIDRALSDTEIVQLAYGKEITAFGSPAIYLRMNDVADYADTGTQANVVTAAGPLTNGTEPGFGYSTVPAAPSFSSAPSISGAAVVGTTVGYTGGEAIGNPAPVVLRQWTLATTSSGAQADIVGATGTTYTLAADDAGKFLRLRIVADNDIEPNATTTSDPVLVSSTAVDLTLTSIVAESFYQRLVGGPNGQSVVPLVGAFVGSTPAKIEAQIYSPDGLSIVRPWFDVAAMLDATAKTWSANPIIDAPTLGSAHEGNKYRLTVRSVNASGVTMTSSTISPRFGVGDRIVVIGSSSPAEWSGSGSGSGRTPDHNKLSTMKNAAWTLFDQYGQASLMAQHFTNHTGVPTAIINLAEGGTSLSQWARETGSGALWTRVQNLFTQIGPKIAGLFGSAGSNDITSSNSAQTVEAHLALLNSVRDMVRRDTGIQNLPILWSGINRRYDALPLQANNARQAEREFGEQPNIFYVQTLDIEVKDPESTTEPGDGIHPTGSGYSTCCRRIEYVWSEGVYYGRKQRGPVITSIAYKDNKATITIQHRNTNGTDITSRTMAKSSVPSSIVSLTNATGFKIVDDSGSVAIVSLERADGTRITLTCERELVNPKITYLEGAWVDNAVAVFDNAPTALPLMADPIGVAGAGAVYSPVVQALGFTYTVESADSNAPQYRTVFQSLGFVYVVEAAEQSSGSLLTYQMTSSGTLRANQEFGATWYKGGIIGEIPGVGTIVNGVTDAQGRGVLSPLPTGSGFALIEFTDGGVCLQKGMVT